MRIKVAYVVPGAVGSAILKDKIPKDTRRLKTTGIVADSWVACLIRKRPVEEVEFRKSAR